MTDVRSVALTTAEIEAFLGDGGTGVLSVARDDEPYSFPVSYGFAVDDGEFYLRLGYDDDSSKAGFVDEPCPAQLVVYEEATDGDGSLAIKSVVATGELVRIPKSDLTPADVERVERGRLAGRFAVGDSRSSAQGCSNAPSGAGVPQTTQPCAWIASFIDSLTSMDSAHSGHSNRYSTD